MHQEQFQVRPDGTEEKEEDGRESRHGVGLDPQLVDHVAVAELVDEDGRVGDDLCGQCLVRLVRSNDAGYEDTVCVSCLNAHSSVITFDNWKVEQTRNCATALVG